VPRRHGGTDAVGNLAPAHGQDDRTGASGVDFRCHECGGVACNQAYRNAATTPAVGYRSRDW
jgi:hypothetical protein